MNLKHYLTLTFGCFVAFTAISQEYDDMYFNSKDRAKINKNKISADLGLAKNAGRNAEAITPINTTDSYSARNINPEYAAQINSGSAPTIEDDYFIADFQPTGVNRNLSNCNCGSGSFYNPYYGNNAFNNPYYGYSNGFGSPYSSFYPSSWGYPSYGGFRSGLSMGYGYGGYYSGLYSGLGSGFYSGLGYGYGSYGGNFWNPYNSLYGGYYGYYPGQTIIINNGDTGANRVSYTKRSSRSSSINHAVDNSRPNTIGNVTTTGRSTVSGGRSRSSSPAYYDSGWKRNQTTSPTRSYWSNSGGSNTNTRSDFNRGNTNYGGRQSYSTPSRGSFNTGGTNSGGSRSGSSGTSGGSRTRGRNN